MNTDRPRATAGLRHVALYVSKFDRCVEFYVNLMGMEVEWHPDEDNIFLTSGNDNLALHRRTEPATAQGQRLDHIGFIIEGIDEVDRWYRHLADSGVSIPKAPKTHRDGGRSFMCLDPDGTMIQIMFHPPLSAP